MNSTAIEERLKTAVPNFFKKVQGAVALSEVTKTKILVSPTLFVVPLTEKGGSREDTTGPVGQSVNDKFAVVIAIKNVSNSKGTGANTQFDLVKNKVRELLFGWVMDQDPTKNYLPNVMGNSGLVALKDYTLWWQEEFTTSHYQLAQ